MTDRSVTVSLYRLFDDDGGLLYIGIAGNPGRRFTQHERDKMWWGDVASITLEHFASREDAVDAERMAIRRERPRHNDSHNPVRPWDRLHDVHDDYWDPIDGDDDWDDDLEDAMKRLS